jgi:hypothetical protein
MTALIVLLSSCVNDDITVDEFIDDNPNYKDELVFTSEIETVYFSIYLSQLSSSRMYIYEYESNPDLPVSSIRIYCEGDGPYENIHVLPLREVEMETGFLPKLTCDNRIGVRVSFFDHESYSKIGFIEE